MTMCLAFKRASQQLGFAIRRIVFNESVARNRWQRANSFRGAADQVERFKALNRSAGQDPIGSRQVHIFAPARSVLANQVRRVCTEFGEAEAIMGPLAQAVGQELSQKQGEMTFGPFFRQG